MKKLLAIMGSPRKNGNCAKMLTAAIDDAKAKGYEVDYFDLYDGGIADCRGCMACKRTRVCIIDDGITALREKLIACDIVVIVSPTYFANVTAPVKKMFDRLVGAVMDDNASCIPKPLLKKSQRYVLMTACSTPFPFNALAGQSSGALKAMKEFFHTAGMRCGGKIVLSGTKKKNVLPSKLVAKIRRSIK